MEQNNKRKTVKESAVMSVYEITGICTEHRVDGLCDPQNASTTEGLNIFSRLLTKLQEQDVKPGARLFITIEELPFEACMLCGEIRDENREHYFFNNLPNIQIIIFEGLYKVSKLAHDSCAKSAGAVAYICPHCKGLGREQIFDLADPAEPCPICCWNQIIKI